MEEENEEALGVHGSDTSESLTWTRRRSQGPGKVKVTYSGRSHSSEIMQL